MTSPWLTTEEVAVLLRFLKRRDGTPNAKGARRFLDRHHIPTIRRGGIVLAHVDDVNAFMVPRNERPHGRLRRVR